MVMKDPTVQSGSSVGEPLPPGSRIGRYEVLSLLGGGGMGVVYRATDTRLQREVAIKVLHDKESVPGMRERLLREARAVSAINHPSICTLFDIGEQDGDPYLVMELLQGETLRDRIRKKPLTPAEVVEYSLQIADALAEAHDNSIIHRDIKPANIFLCNKASGAIQVKVLDFGLAKRRTDIEHDSLNLTEPGTTIGTIAYMSPEQARGEPLDARTDLFSFGAVMYEMATNKVPFTGQTSAMVFVELLERNPKPVRERNRHIPLELAAIINKALMKDYTDRYQSAVEIHADLEAVWAEVWATSNHAAFHRSAGLSKKHGAKPLKRELHELVVREEVASSIHASVETPASINDVPLPPAALPESVVPATMTTPGVVTVSQENISPIPNTTIRNSVSEDGIYPLPPTLAIPTVVTPLRANLVDPYTEQPRGVRSPANSGQKTESATRTKSQVSPEKAKQLAEARRKDRAKLRLLYFLSMIFVLTIGAGIYIQFGKATGNVGLQPGDTIMIGKIENNTESTKLDHAFRVGLAIELDQSPYINTILGADGATQVAGEKGTLVGSISGQDPYVIDLKLVPPNGGKQIAEVEDTAQELENVMETIGRMTLDLRRQVGESTTSRDAYFRPLHQEATSSLDALEDFSTGEMIMASHGDPNMAIAAYLRALEGDKYFTLASERLAVLYAAANNAQAAVQYAEDAYSGRQTLSERSRLEIEVVHAVLVEKNQPDINNWVKQLHSSYPGDISLNPLVKK